MPLQLLEVLATLSRWGTFGYVILPRRCQVKDICTSYLCVKHATQQRLVSTESLTCTSLIGLT